MVSGHKLAPQGSVVHCCSHLTVFISNKSHLFVIPWKKSKLSLNLPVQLPPWRSESLLAFPRLSLTILSSPLELNSFNDRFFLFGTVLYIDSHPVLLFHYFCHCMSIVTILFLILIINSRYFVPRNNNYIASLLNKHHLTQDLCLLLS